jgi:hypothetical protein
MFRFIVLVAIIAAAAAYKARPANLKVAAKIAGASLIASTLVGAPMSTLAKEGDGAKLGIFSEGDISSPFTNEKREDPLYSPYSPYGDGSAAAYNKVKGGKEEIAFWNGAFDECAKRVDNVPKYVKKKTWYEITNELTRYTYNMRESMLRLSEASQDPSKSSLLAKAYFCDLNDLMEWAIKKDGPTVMKAYEQSKTDLAAFKAAVGKK